MALIPSPKDGDWTSLRSALRKLASLKLGTDSTPTFAGLTLVDSFSLSYLTQGSILFAGSSGLISQDNTNLSWDDATDTLTVSNIIDSGLTASKGVYTDASKQLTSTPPTSGTLGYWSRAGTVLSTATVGDNLSLGTAGSLAIKGAAHTYDGLNIGSADSSDLIGIYHDNAHAHIKWNDGYLKLEPDEGTDASGVVAVYGKGNGFGIVRAYDHDRTHYWQFYALDDIGYMDVRGTAPVAVSIQKQANVPIRMFEDAPTGLTPELQLFGFRTADQLRTLAIGVGVDAADTASFDGLSTYLFDGKIAFTQVDGNEYIDSVNDGYVDIGATTGQRFHIGGTEQINLIDGVSGPKTDSDVDLGTTGARWKDAFVDSVTVTGAGTFDTVDATTDFTIGDTVITDGVITDTTGLSIVANTVITGTLGCGAITQSGTLLDNTYHPLTTVGIADDNLVEIDSADVADDDYAKFTANGLEGRTLAEMGADGVMLADGSIDFTAVVVGVLPTAGAHLATKEYVDLALGARKHFFMSDTASGVGALNYAYPRETAEAESTIVTAALGLGDAQLVKGFITEAGEPSTTTFNPGVVAFDIHAKKGADNQRATQLYAVLSWVDADGTSNKTTIATSAICAELTDTESICHMHASVAAPVEVASTARLIVDIYANVGSGAQDSVVTLYMEGVHDTHFDLEVTGGIWQTYGAVLDDLNTLGQVGADSEFLVGTATGVFAWESGATVRTSLGLGTGDSPTFTGLSLTDLTVTNDIIGSITGTAAIATVLETSRDFSVSGDATTAAGVGFTGAANVDLAITIGADKVLDSHINWGTGATQVSAVDLPIADSGNIITATEVEAALQENRTAIDLNTVHVADNTQAHTDYLINNGADSTSGVLTAAGFVGPLTGNVTGNADTVTTNANLTGIVTSVGNATAIANKAIAIAKLADGTDGELITWDTNGVIAAVAVGTAGHVLTSGGTGVAPTFQAASGGGFVDRGDPASADYAEGDLTEDGAWHELDLGPDGAEIVPAGAKAVLLAVWYQAHVLERFCSFRKYGNSNDFNISKITCGVLDRPHTADLVVPCDAGGSIEYKLSSPDTTIIRITVKGWWL